MAVKLKKAKDGSMTISCGRNRLTLTANEYETVLMLHVKMKENPDAIAVEADGDQLIISQPLKLSEAEIA